MNELVEKLLEPVSPDQPCGPDLSYDPRFEELETILKGKPEVEIGSVQKPAEPPDWGELKEKSAEFLRQSKHLRAATMLCCSLLKTGGVAGFLDGLQLVRGLLEQYWPVFYPLLDADDNNDPTQRLNTLLALTAPRGSVGGWRSVCSGAVGTFAFGGYSFITHFGVRVVHGAWKPSLHLQNTSFGLTVFLSAGFSIPLRTLVLPAVVPANVQLSAL